MFNFQNYTDEDIKICSPVISLKTKIVLTLKYFTLCPSRLFHTNHYLFYAFFWVIPRRLKFICRRFGTLCLFHLHRLVGACFRRRGITQNKAYNIQYTAKV